MPLALKIAFRFLSLRRGGLGRFTAIAAASMVAIGVFAFLLTDTLSNAFETSLITSLIRSEPHLVIVPKVDAEKIDLANLIKNSSDVGSVAGVRPAAATHALMSANGISKVVLIRSFETESAGLVLGDLLAEDLRVSAGDEAELVVQVRDGNPRKVRTRVGRTETTGLYEDDSTVVRVTPTEYAAIVGDEIFTPEYVEVFLDDPMTADIVAARIESVAGDGIKALTWKGANFKIFESLRAAESFSAMIVLLFAAFGMLALAITAAVLVRERTGDIAIFRILGMRRGTIVSIVALHVAAIAAAGSLFGVAIFVLMILTLDPQHYLSSIIGAGLPVRSLSIRLSAIEPILAVASAVVSAVFSGLLPALRASRIKPLAGLRQS